MKLFDFDTEKNWDYENGFNITCDKTRIGKFLAHYELYKRIAQLPGVVVEAGVFKAGSFIRFATFRDLIEFPCSRKIIGFDAFGFFPRQKIEGDDVFAQRHDDLAGKGITKEQLQRVLNYKNIENTELVKGDIIETVPQYVNNNPSLRIAPFTY